MPIRSFQFAFHLKSYSLSCSSPNEEPPAILIWINPTVQLNRGKGEVSQLDFHGP